MATRGFFMGSFGEEKEFFLKMRIKGLAPKQGRMEYPIGVELEILEDGFGIFEDHKQVFFAATSRGGLMAHRVVTRGYNSPGAPSGGQWGRWGAEDGYSRPLVFFAEEPGTQISIGDNSPDSLLFTGISNSPSGHRNCLHFLRVVKKDKKEVGEDLSELEKRFTEDVWYAKGKGLVYLIQKVGGKVSMTWTLKNFSK